MNQKISTEDVLIYIRSNPNTRVKDIVEHFGVTPPTIHAHLNRLLAQWKIEKIGTTPHTRYRAI